MKKILYLCLPIFFLYSCSKSDKSPTPAPTPDTSNLITMNAMILLENDTLTSIVQQSASYHQLVVLTFYLSPLIANSASDTTRCTLSGLPISAVASPASAAISLPGTWTTFLYMNADLGLYHLALNVVNAKGTRVIPFNVQVVP